MMKTITVRQIDARDGQRHARRFVASVDTEGRRVPDALDLLSGVSVGSAGWTGLTPALG